MPKPIEESKTKETSEKEVVEEIIEIEVVPEVEIEQEVTEQTEIAPLNNNELEAYNITLSLEETNYIVHSWSTLMIKLADAKYIYDNPATSQLDVENVVAELE